MAYQRSSRLGTWDKHAMACSDEPAAAFARAIADLAPHVREIMGLPLECQGDIQVLGVTLKYSRRSQEIRQAHLLAVVALPRTRSAMKLKVPVAFGISRSAIDALFLSRVSESILNVLAHADLYLDGGNRAQGSLFDPPGADDAPPADDRPADDAPAAPPPAEGPASNLPSAADTYKYLFAKPDDDADAGDGAE
jgi:hypothetical protein